MYKMKITWAVAAAAVALNFATAGFAQQPGRIRGQIDKIDGTRLSRRRHG